MSAPPVPETMAAMQLMDHGGVDQLQYPGKIVVVPDSEWDEHGAPYAIEAQ